MYHAIVLYADEDRPFVEEMIQRMNNEGCQICTLDDLRAVHGNQDAPAAQLISEQSLSIILVLSPEFLNSSGMNFYVDYAQAISIELSQRKIIPIMYRTCELPRHLTYYHKLFYQCEGRPMYDFWLKLQRSLMTVRLLAQN